MGKEKRRGHAGSQGLASLPAPCQAPPDSTANSLPQHSTLMVNLEPYQCGVMWWRADKQSALVLQGPAARYNCGFKQIQWPESCKTFAGESTP